MVIFIISILALWIYPLFGLAITYRFKNKPKLKKWVYISSFSLSGIAIIGYLTQISTTSTAIDWFILSTLYLSTSLIICWIHSNRRLIVKIAAVILMIGVFGPGYLISTIGFLGLGFIVGEYETTNEKWMEDGIIYKEVTLGNAISDYKGKRVELFKTIPWFPIIEWKIQEKEYFNIITYMNELDVVYNSEKKEIYLSKEMEFGKEKEIQYFNDTIVLE